MSARVGTRIGRSARAGRVAGLVVGLAAGWSADGRADEAPPRRTPYQIENSRLVTPGPVLFQAGSDKLKPESEAALEHVRAYLADKTYISTLRIEVHSDNQGDPQKNQALTEQRALAVARALVKKGVDCKRLVAVGFGDSKPVADNRTPEGRAENRRVSFINAALRGRAINGMPLDGGGKSVSAELCAEK
jgi:OOP family OmpA-OmpF porin